MPLPLFSGSGHSLGADADFFQGLPGPAGPGGEAGKPGDRVSSTQIQRFHLLLTVSYTKYTKTLYVSK